MKGSQFHTRQDASLDRYNTHRYNGSPDKPLTTCKPQLGINSKLRYNDSHNAKAFGNA